MVEGKPFYVHEDLIGQYSKPLSSMMFGSFKEGQERVATIEEVDQATFHRFLDWLYKGYYYAAEPSHATEVQEAKISTPQIFSEESREVVDIPVEEPPAEPIDDAVEEPQPVIEEAPDFGWGNFGKKKGKKKGYSGGYHVMPVSHEKSPKEEFIERSYTVRNILKDRPQPRSNKNSGEDYSEVFLCHARLYRFAEMQNIQSLRVLAMEELHAVLAVFTLYKSRTGDILALLEYIYSETRKENTGEDLYTLVMEYVEVEIATLVQDETLGSLLMDDGVAQMGEVMLEDFLKVIRKKIS